jgi:hypothetical protein
MGMKGLCSNIDKFLSRLDDYFPRILKESTSRLLMDPHALQDINCVVLHSNNIIFQEHFFYKVFGITKPLESTLDISGTEYEYIYSDKHIEIDMCADMLAHVKGIVSNKPINGNRFVVFIKGLERASNDLQLALKNVIDIAPETSCFVISMNSASKLHECIKSRAMMVNMAFMIDKVHEVVQEFFNESIPFDRFYVEYIRCNLDLVSVIIMRTFRVQATEVDKLLSSFIRKTNKEKNVVVAITDTRDLAYKLFHINFPLSLLCKMIIHMFCNSSLAAHVVGLCADHEKTSVISKKDVLVYEKVLMGIANLVIKDNVNILLPEDDMDEPIPLLPVESESQSNPVSIVQKQEEEPKPKRGRPKKAETASAKKPPPEPRAKATATDEPAPQPQAPVPLKKVVKKKIIPPTPL